MSQGSGFGCMIGWFRALFSGGRAMGHGLSYAFRPIWFRALGLKDVGLPDEDDLWMASVLQRSQPKAEETFPESGPEL